MYARYAKLRDERKMTDYEVAKKAGIKKSTFYTWRQKSRTNPNLSMSLANMCKLADALGVDLNSIVKEGE